MLSSPVSFTDLVEGKVSPKEVFELKTALERQGKQIEYVFDYPGEKVWGEYFRCRGCGLYFEWHEGVLRGGKPNDRRNQCRECYRYYHFYTQADEYKPLKKHSAKEQQRQWGHDLYGGWYWSYMIKTTYEEALALYFGATENMVSRENQHYYASSNPMVHDLFTDKKQILADNIFAFVKPISFRVFGHNTLEEAYRHERELWEYWKQRERDGNDVKVLNVNPPAGAPPIKNAA